MTPTPEGKREERTAEEIAEDLGLTMSVRIQTSHQLVGGLAPKVDFEKTFSSWIAAALREYAKAEVAKVKADSEIIAKAHNDIVRNWDEEIAEVRSKALAEAAGVCFGQYEWHMKHERYCCAKTAKQCRSGILALQSSPGKGVGMVKGDTFNHRDGQAELDKFIEKDPRRAG